MLSLLACATRRAASTGVVKAAALPLLTAQPHLWASYSSDALKGPDEKSAAYKNAEKMVELMSTSPQLQQMMLSAMPAPFRSSSMLQMVLQDPRMKARIASMIADQGMAIPQEVLDKVSASNLEATFTKAEGAGLNPVQLFNSLINHPDLLAKLRDQRVMAAFMDITRNPAIVSKYESEPDILEVVQRVRDILSSQRPAPSAGATTSPEAIKLEGSTADLASSSSSSSSSAADSTAATEPASGTASDASAPSGTSGTSTDEAAAAAAGAAAASAAAAGGEGMNPLVMMLASNPASAHHVRNPRVVEALKVIQKSPWKTVKYMFDKEVMTAMSDCKKIMQGKPL